LTARSGPAHDLPTWARVVAQRLLADELPERWVHTQKVAERARDVGPVLGWETDLIEAAAWLHDVGYASALNGTGFHPLDGARHLRDVEDAEATVCMLVAHHTGAEAEARERGLAEALLTEFPLNSQGARVLLTALTYCDLTVSPSGEPLTPGQRIAEILSRYEPTSPVHVAVQKTARELLDQCQPITAALIAAGRV
jgi:HD domain